MVLYHHTTFAATYTVALSPLICLSLAAEVSTHMSQQDPSPFDLPILELLPHTPPASARHFHVPPPLSDSAHMPSDDQFSPTDEYLRRRGLLPNNIAGQPVPLPVLQPAGGQGGSDHDSNSGIHFRSSSSVPEGMRLPVTVDPEVPNLLKRPLHPCAAARESEIHNLLDAVWVELPPVPALYRAKALGGTRKPSTFDCNLPTEDQLQKIVVLESKMLEDIQAEVATLLRRIPIDCSNADDRAFLHRIWTWDNALDCPKIINSEVDTEDWTNAVLFRPAMAIIHAILQEGISGGISVGDEPRYPFLASAHSSLSNKPDGIVTNEGVYPDEEVGLCKEDKTHGVYSFTDNPLEPVQTPPAGQPSGAAHKFNWPEVLEDLQGYDKTGSSIMVQVLMFSLCNA
ncbi:hypothetical protein EWM64_g8920 [Hericium alpestre]|uniref:Uncharacterized protein n=1 Tax=Hericium alpestre TaxID=135208 RepID=A0A4Y9ZK25_9AGAM|nr:hypothetical protein EWM64_g8920 [Hericium alpestre]